MNVVVSSWPCSHELTLDDHRVHGLADVVGSAYLRIFTRALSPWTTVMLSGGTLSSSAHTWASVVSMPCPHRRHAGVHDDVPRRVDLDPRVLPRAEPGLLDEEADPDADVPVLASCLRLLA